MKKANLLISTVLLLACSSDPESIDLESENGAPVIGSEAFTIAEHSAAGTAIGFLEASDKENDELTFSLDSDFDLQVDEVTGELTVGANLTLDYETNPSIPFTISVFDGTSIVEKDLLLTIEDVDETTLLSPEQQELITYFQHLAFWKGTNHTPIQFNQKWDNDMMLYLDGTISTAFEATVESVLSQYNALTIDGDFDMALVENSSEANAHLFFGTEEELETVWPDMHEIVAGGNFNGYAMTPSQNSVLISTRIWISNPAEVLLKHELGHALGFGHSNKCDAENSFLCSQISLDNDFLPVEEQIIRLMYHAEVPAGLTETELEMVLANLLITQQ